MAVILTDSTVCAKRVSRKVHMQILKRKHDTGGQKVVKQRNSTFCLLGKVGECERHISYHAHSTQSHQPTCERRIHPTMAETREKHTIQVQNIKKKN